MPVFEYKCSKCDTKFEIFHKSSANLEEVVCPKCASRESKKLFSTFAPSMGSGSSSDSCASGSCGAQPFGGCANGMCGLN